LTYAESVGISGTDNGRAQALDASGYYWLGGESDAMLCAGGPIAISHLPAHAHVHPAHVSLYLDGLPILTDTGTYTYASGQQRTAARSISGHNTVQFGQREPVAIADSFLMGAPIRPEATLTTSNVTALITAYDTTFDRSYSHRRILYHADDWWFVWDTVDANEAAEAVARYHCHPSVEVTADDGGGYRLARPSGARCHVRSLRVDSTTVQRSEYYPEFGVVQERPVLTLQSDADCSHAMGCLFQTGETAVDLSTDRGNPTNLTVGENTYELPGLSVGE
jgi:hypothetical protein